MPQAPSDNADKTLSYSIYSEGHKVNDSFSLSFAEVRKEINRIGKAILKFDAGDMSKGSFDEVDSDVFKPGNKIRLDVGNVQEEKTIFSGMITQLGIEIEEDSHARMVVECRDCAYAATLGRKNRIFEKKKDSEIIAQLLKNYSSVTVDNTTYQHASLVQYYSTDWDFVLSRADANGLVVTIDHDKIFVKKPDVSSAPVLNITYGTDIIDLEGCITVADQYTKVTAVSWNPSKQAVETSDSSNPTLNHQGNLALSDIQQNEVRLLQSDAFLENAALQNWADSQALKAGLARYQGSFLIYGNAAVIPGCLVSLNGLGKRFNGNVYVGSVEHTLENNLWTTRIGMGLSVRDITEETDVTSLPASGWVPGIEGLHIGVVKQLNDDPAKEQKILIEIPWLNGTRNTLWARLSHLYAGEGRGMFFLPEAGDEVVVGFFNNDPGNPVILGSMYSSKHAPAYQLTKENEKKAIITQSQMKIEFDEKTNTILIQTPSKNQLELSDDSKSIKISDQNKNVIILDSNGITLDSAKDIILKAKGNIGLDAVSKVSVKAKSDVTLEGLNIKATAKAGFTAKGNATAELSASGQTTVKGGMVMIN